MSEFDFKNFRRRVRFVRAWKGLGVGLAAGAGVFAVGVVADFARAVSVEPGKLALWGAGAGLLTSLAFALMPLKQSELARSIDRRARLKDRLTTAVEPGMDQQSFGDAVIQDAGNKVQGVNPAVIYPWRWGRPHSLAVALAVLGFSIFLLGNSGVLLSPAAKSVREAMAKKADEVERVALKLEQLPANARLGDDEKKLGDKIRDMARNMKRGKMDKEESLRKANEISQEAKELLKKRIDQTSETMAKANESLAKSALDRLKIDQNEMGEAKLTPEELQALKSAESAANINQAELDAQAQAMDQALEGMKVDSSMRRMASMSKAQRQSLAKSLRAQINALKSELQQKMSSEQRKALESQLKVQQDLLKNLKLSEDFYKAMKELMASKEYQQLQKLAGKLKAAQGKLMKGQKLTAADIEELQRQADAFAAAMKDPAQREAMLKQIRDMIEALKRGDVTMGAGFAVAGLMGLDIPVPDGMGNASHGGVSGGEGKVIHQDKARDPKGKTTETQVSGERDPNKGSETFTTIKAPTMVGTRTSIPYRDVLPKYRTQAEKALGQKKIPKKYEKRVKEYFESLNGGK